MPGHDLSLRHLPDLSLPDTSTSDSFSFSFQIPGEAGDDLLRGDSDDFFSRAGGLLGSPIRATDTTFSHGGNDASFSHGGDLRGIDTPPLTLRELSKVSAGADAPPTISKTKSLLPTTRSNMTGSITSRVPKPTSSRAKPKAQAASENREVSSTALEKPPTPPSSQVHQASRFESIPDEKPKRVDSSPLKPEKPEPPAHGDEKLKRVDSPPAVPANPASLADGDKKPKQRLDSPPAPVAKPARSLPPRQSMIVRPGGPRALAVPSPPTATVPQPAAAATAAEEKPTGIAARLLMYAGSFPMTMAEQEEEDEDQTVPSVLPHVEPAATPAIDLPDYLTTESVTLSAIVTESAINTLRSPPRTIQDSPPSPHAIYDDAGVDSASEQQVAADTRMHMDDAHATAEDIHTHTPKHTTQEIIESNAHPVPFDRDADPKEHSDTAPVDAESEPVGTPQLLPAAAESVHAGDSNSAPSPAAFVTARPASTKATGKSKAKAESDKPANVEPRTAPAPTKFTSTAATKPVSKTTKPPSTKPASKATSTTNSKPAKVQPAAKPPSSSTHPKPPSSSAHPKAHDQATVGVSSSNAKAPAVVSSSKAASRAPAPVAGRGPPTKSKPKSASQAQRAQPVPIPVLAAPTLDAHLPEVDEQDGAVESEKVVEDGVVEDTEMPLTHRNSNTEPCHLPDVNMDVDVGPHVDTDIKTRDSLPMIVEADADTHVGDRSPLTLSQLSPRKINIPDAGEDIRAPSPMRPASKRSSSAAFDINSTSVAGSGSGSGNKDKRSRVGAGADARVVSGHGASTAARGRGRGRARVVSAPVRVQPARRTRTESSEDAKVQRKPPVPRLAASTTGNPKREREFKVPAVPVPWVDASSATSTSTSGSGSSGKHKHATASTSATAETDGNERKPKPYTIPDFKSLHASLAASRTRRAPTVPHSPALTTRARAQERAKFDTAVHEKQVMLEAEREERRKAEEEREELEMKEMRKKAVVKAHEVPGWYKEMPKRERVNGEKEE
ncbi:hypothetical protein C8R43DRAFT_1109895 [Mycena crocata]|nr:hypothetical protein C8R43DRAFT_1109895 [Mycena crocata]